MRLAAPFLAAADRLAAAALRVAAAFLPAAERLAAVDLAAAGFFARAEPAREDEALAAPARLGLAADRLAPPVARLAAPPDLALAPDRAPAELDFGAARRPLPRPDPPLRLAPLLRRCSAIRLSLLQYVGTRARAWRGLRPGLSHAEHGSDGSVVG